MGQFMGNQAEIALLIKRGRWDRAEQLCQAEILAHPADPQTWYYLGAVQSMQGRRSEAIRSLKLAASYSAGTGGSPYRDAAAENQELLLSTAQALLRLRAYAEALPLYQRLDFALPQVILGLGRCYWGLGDYQQALAHFSGLWEARPQWVDLGLTYARALCSVDRHQEAGEILRALLQQNPHEAEIIHQYALWLLSCQGEQQARQWLIKQQPGRPAEKLALLQRALQQPEHAPAIGQAGAAKVGKVLSDDLPVNHLAPKDTNTRGTALNNAVSDEINWLNQRQQSQWQSFQTLRQMPGEPLWFGDNAALLKHAVKQLPAQGIVVECGVFHGRSLNLLAQWSQRECHGFDSFEGLPEAWNEQEPAGAYSTRGKAPQVAANVTLHRGWFDQTLPAFTATLDKKIALLHVDCDLYSSTVSVLRYLLPYLAVDSIIVFDDMAGYPEWREHEYRAWMECVEAHHLNYGLIGAVMLGRSVALRLLPS